MNRPPQRNDRAPATLSDIRDGLEKLCGDIGMLQREVKQLSDLICPLPKGKRRSLDDDMHLDYSRGERAATPDPTRLINEAIRSVAGADTLEAQGAILKAIARDLDGALRDIRSAKIDIKSISDDGDAREAFRKSRNR